MTVLSVNINKVAVIRNSRGGNVPNIVNVALDCERFGAQGITVHPRPDERHITYNDVIELKPLLITEFNIEGFPSEKFMELVVKVKPVQVTLVPDSPDAITSNAGWDTIKHEAFLRNIIGELRKNNIRSSVFTGTDFAVIEKAKEIGADRIELYTEPYAENYAKDEISAVLPFRKAAEYAIEIGLGVNAGHDLSLENLSFFSESIPLLKEVSIGHALISDALYYGLENTIQMYKRQLVRSLK